MVITGHLARFRGGCDSTPEWYECSSQRGRHGPTRSAALVLLLAAAAIVAASAHAAAAAKPRVTFAFVSSAKLTISGLNCSHAVTFTSATCTFTTNAAAQVSVATGADKSVLVPTIDASYRTVHNVTVRGESPSSSYVALITATDRNKRATTAWTSFQTLGVGSQPATVTVTGDRWLLDGQRFIPIVARKGAGCVTSDLVKSDATMGIMVLFFQSVLLNGANCGNQVSDQIPLIHQALAGQMWWQYDPDPVTPDPLDPNQAEVVRWPTNGVAQIGANTYTAFSVCGGYSYYLDAKIAQEAPNAVEMAIAASLHLSGQQRLNCIDTAQLANQFWIGASRHDAIAYSTDSTDLTPRPFDVAPTIQAEAGALAGQLKTLGPVLNWGTPVAVKVVQPMPTAPPNPRGTIRAFGWKYGGRFYVLVINTSYKPAAATISAAPLKNAVGNALWQKGTLHSTNGAATIKLGRLAVTWYEVRTNGRS